MSFIFCSRLRVLKFPKKNNIVMKIFVKAKPSARETKVEKTDETHLIISVKEPPVQGRANAAIVAACAEYFNVPEYKVAIVSGRTSREKIIEIQL